ncbi:MAG: HpcH/HpaI aldolase family protein [Bacillota bacterium]
MTVFDARFRGYLRENRPLIGFFTGITSPALVEMAGHANFDFVIIDNEHGPGGIETTEHMIRAARCAGIVPLVRVSGANPQEILRTLDVGASGVQVPQVNTAEQARLVVDAVKFPPAGNRGVAYSTRAGGYGFFGGPGHIHASNEHTVVITHIETVESVKNLDAILTVKGIDVLFVGPSDLSVSMGYPGNPGHPEVQATIADCLKRIAAAGITPGVLITSKEEFHKFAALGARFMPIMATTVIAGAMKGLIAGTKEALI